MPHDTNKKQKLSSISFDHEGAHVALVGQHQGGPANGKETLVFKTKDTRNIMDQDLEELQKETNVRVTMTFTEFLVRWFDMWWDDADVLATLLGMEEDFISNLESDNPYKEAIEERVGNIEVMKSAEKALNKGELQSFIDNLSEEEYKSLRKAKRLFEDGVAKSKGLASSGDLGDGNTEGKDIDKSSGQPKDDNQHDKGNEMTEEELQAKIQKAKEEGKSEVAQDLEKAREELESLRKEKEQREKQEYVELVKSYSFVEEGKQEDLAKALMVLEKASQDALKDTLEKAQKAIDEFAPAQGHDGEGDEDQLEKSGSRVRDHIAKRHGNK